MGSVTGDGLKGPIGLNSLHTLNLGRTQVMDAGLKSLHALDLSNELPDGATTGSAGGWRGGGGWPGAASGAGTSWVGISHRSRRRLTRWRGRPVAASGADRNCWRNRHRSCRRLARRWLEQAGSGAVTGAAGGLGAVAGHSRTKLLRTSPAGPAGGWHARRRGGAARRPADASHFITLGFR